MGSRLSRHNYNDFWMSSFKMLANVSKCLYSIICSKSKKKNSIMCPFTACFRWAEEMTHECAVKGICVSLTGTRVCQWYYCISVIHTPQGRANHWGFCCGPKCEEFLSCCQEQAELWNDNVRLETYRIKNARQGFMYHIVLKQIWWHIHMFQNKKILCLVFVLFD